MQLRNLVGIAAAVALGVGVGAAGVVTQDSSGNPIDAFFDLLVTC